MILSGDEIHQSLGSDIIIEPFDAANLNPNSYNLSLHHEIMTYEEVVLDMQKCNRIRRLNRLVSDVGMCGRGLSHAGCLL